MSTFGKKIEVSLFGESHGDGIGITISNFPAGIKLNFDGIKNDLTLRRPKSAISTARVENDPFKILSGYYNGFTTGAPLTFLIENNNKRSKDYNNDIVRPSHADYTSHVKYNGFEDFRGGGHFSGRLTAPIIILGSICKEVLRSKNIYVGSHISSIKDVNDVNLASNELSAKILTDLSENDFPLLDPNLQSIMENVILSAKNNKDSVGGEVETFVLGLNPGYGEPFFDSIESTLAHLLFSVPAIKGVSFGKGFDITNLFGSEANDSFYVEDKTIKTKTNNSGGIQGGISNGMPISFKVAVKPTASIGKKQNTVNIKTLENTTLELEGRHDPCIVQRVIHVINAITNYGILEIILRREGYTWIQ